MVDALHAGTIDAAVTHIELVVERLELVNAQIERAERAMDALVAGLVETPARDGPDASVESDDPVAAATPPSDAAILLSVPGVGTKVLATLLADGGDAVRRRDYDALRCLCGVAPVTRRSGKSLFVTRRLAAHHRLRDAAYHWARNAMQKDPVSREKYRALRARGHGHARALRSVADRLLGVTCVLLRNGTVFDVSRAEARVANGSATAR